MSGDLPSRMCIESDYDLCRCVLWKYSGLLEKTQNTLIVIVVVMSYHGSECELGIFLYLFNLCA